MDFKRGMRDKLDKHFDLNEKFEIDFKIDGDAIYDFSCFCVDENNKLIADEYIIFYNQLCSPENEVSFAPEYNRFTVDLRKVSSDIKKIVFTVTIDGNGCMSEIKKLLVSIAQNNSEKISIESSGTDYHNEKAIIIAEIYFKDVWRIGAVLNGFNGGLSALLNHFGGEEESDDNSVPNEVPKNKVTELRTEVSNVSENSNKNNCTAVKETEAFNCNEITGEATVVTFKYNPYTVESIIEIDGNEIMPPNKLCDLKNERMQVWVDQFLPNLIELCNDSSYEINFYGLRLDYDDLYITIKDYCEEHKNINVNLHFTEAKGSEDRLNELQALFDDMQADCPFEDLKTQQIKENFSDAMRAEFEVSVIATMSSGKSTLINSLLGQELMPSKNEACTATIAKIKDTNNGKGFRAVYRDRDNNTLGEFSDVSLADMEQMNSDINTAYIDIEGNIPNIDSSGIKLVLVDTPGPNNSRTEEHRNHTYRVIKEKSKPMVLYVLNATQLQTNDDYNLLSVVAEAMKVGGKQSKDRFIFAVNKIDQFDPDKESVHEALEHVREYLKKFDIENPNIFPTSAETAKVIRMMQNGAQLTKGQNKVLSNSDFFISEEQLHLSEQASLSKNNLAIVKNRINNAKLNNDKFSEIMMYTGIPAVELAINEYLKKYAYTTKIKAAVDSFRKKVEEKDMKAKMLDSISNNENKREEIHQQLESLKKIFEDGKEAEKFRKKIEELDMAKDAKMRIRQIRARISKELNPSGSKGAMTTLEVQQMMMTLNSTVNHLQSDVKTELDNIINEVIVNNADMIIKDYTAHIHNLIQSGIIENKEYSGVQNSGIGFLEMDIPNAQEIINNYKYDERYAVDEEWVENTNKKWYKPWTWFEEKGHWKTIYANREMVDYATVENEYLTPVISSFNENISNAQNVALEEAERFKQFFINQLDELDNALKKKVEETEQLTQNSKNISNVIAEDKLKMEWLDTFMKRLDSILEI